MFVHLFIHLFIYSFVYTAGAGLLPLAKLPAAGAGLASPDGTSPAPALRHIIVCPKKQPARVNIQPCRL